MTDSGYKAKHSGSWAHSINHHVTLPLKEPSCCEKPLHLLITDGHWAFPRIYSNDSIKFCPIFTKFFLTFFRLKYFQVEIIAIYGSYLMHRLVLCVLCLKYGKLHIFLLAGWGIKCDIWKEGKIWSDFYFSKGIAILPIKPGQMYLFLVPSRALEI